MCILEKPGIQINQGIANSNGLKPYFFDKIMYFLKKKYKFFWGGRGEENEVNEAFII